MKKNNLNSKYNTQYSNFQFVPEKNSSYVAINHHQCSQDTSLANKATAPNVAAFVGKARMIVVLIP